MPSRIRVVTDSTCDIPDSLARRYEITVVPMQLSWGAETYLDKLGIGTDDALTRIRTGGVFPVVDAPDVDDFSRTYRLLRESCDGVISVHLSSKLSDAVTNAGIAREAFGPIGQGGPFPVAVVDSLSVS
ncbi:MAG TPA: DegV family protein, partial [Chloroflexia bacterium]|nr:DegV family protein [Chloroflexia bacterium]